MSDINQKVVDAVKNELDRIEKLNISKYQFYFETALYNPVYCKNPLNTLFNGMVDAYNSLDGFDTTYDITQERIDNYDNQVWYGIKKIVLNCKRGGGTALRFIVVILKDGYIMKIGQYPSLADIQFAEIGKKYNKHLSEIDLKNYKKAIGLYAHGAGAGSFVYLRRIFENLIFEAYESHKKVIEGINDSEFRAMRMEEKVEVLKDFLPSQLLSMKSVYGILSKGVHELSEDDCLKYFSPIRLSIQLILDQKIEQAVKAARDLEVKKELQAIHQSINGK